jgi:uncharacterized protein (DUF2252 family)
MFTPLEITFTAVFIAFVAGILLSTEVKDWLRGVPSDVRKSIGDVETNVMAKVTAARAAVLLDLKAAVPAPAKAAAAPVVFPVNPLPAAAATGPTGA